MRLPAIVRALRPQQWVKNVFVLAAVAFARADMSVEHEADFGDVVRSLYAFAAFCLGASAIYLVNDVLDVESDRAHPTKRNRPIAAGEVVTTGTRTDAMPVKPGETWSTVFAGTDLEGLTLKIV